MQAAFNSGAAAAGPELDSAGLYWDGRIHGEKRSKTADGRWKYKRGTPDAYKTQVEAEIRQVLAAPAPAAGASQLLHTHAASAGSPN
jgi:hypothetical protein